MSAPITRRRLMHGSVAAAAGAAGCGASEPLADAGGMDVYSTLGIQPVINAVGTVTMLGGSIMPPEVVEAMARASRSFVPLSELQLKAGARLARLIGVPAAMISCGAASAITCGTAACVTRGDDEKLRALPDTSETRNEIIQQRAHRSGYEAQMRLVGTKTVWVETRQEYERAFNERTAMTFFLNKADPDGLIRRREWLEVAKAHDVPTMNDAAADVPPAERLREYVEEGFELVIFSGGKGLLGPQCTGLLLGREDLVAAAQKAISPRGGIGRGMKVGKEEIAGLVAAVERYLNLDHEAERRRLDARAKRLLEALSGLEGVQSELYVPEIANRVPHVVARWSETERGLTAADAAEKLKAGDPPIWVSRLGDGELRMSMWMLRDGEEAVLAERLREVLS